MINRRKFLQLVRNRVAAGVLCSGMLVDALERSSFELAEVFPSINSDHMIDALSYNPKFWYSQYYNDPTKFHRTRLDGAICANKRINDGL